MRYQHEVKEKNEMEKNIDIVLHNIFVYYRMLLYARA